MQQVQGQDISGLHHKKAHPAIECVQDHGDADKVVRRVVCQILPELADIRVDLRGLEYVMR